MQALLPFAWEQAVDGIFELILFLVATFAAALVASLVGFAFGLVAAAVWLHILTPLQTAILIIAFGFLIQGYAVWKLRGALRWSRLWPFLLGGAFGVPIGVAILTFVQPGLMRAGIGGVLVLYSLYALLRPEIKPVPKAGAAADLGVGVLNGVVGGATGLAGIIVTIWCGLRDWPKDEQRATFQPAGVLVFAMSGAWLGFSEAWSATTGKLFLMGLPALLAGMWLGLHLYGRLDEATFRKLVLGFLLISGAVLIISLK